MGVLFSKIADGRHGIRHVFTEIANKETDDISSISIKEVRDRKHMGPQTKEDDPT